MQKIINNPSDIVDEMLEAYTKAHKDIVSVTGNERVIKYKEAPIHNKVGVVTGGGSGHKPAFIGYVGRNLVDAVACGEIFSSPPAQMFYDAIKSADGGKGVVVIYGNYAGDNMNVSMAMKKAANNNINVRRVIANDDVASAPKTEKQKRRGVAGEIFAWKVAGAKAALGGTIDQVEEISKRAINNTRSMGIGLKPCTIPEVGHPNFIIEDGKMEVGIGHHGEAGIRVSKIEPSEKIALQICEILLPDLPFYKDDEVAILISGLGSTPVIELYVMYNDIVKILQNKNIKVYKSFVGNYFTSLDMAGVTCSLMKLDDELKECLDYECESVAMTYFNKKK